MLSQSCLQVVSMLSKSCLMFVAKDRDRHLLSCREVFRIDVRLMIFFEYICVFTLSWSNQPSYCLGLVTHYWSSIHIQIFEHKSLGFSLKSKLIRKNSFIKLHRLTNCFVLWRQYVIEQIMDLQTKITKVSLFSGDRSTFQFVEGLTIILLFSWSLVLLWNQLAK